MLRNKTFAIPSFAPSYQTGLIWGSKLQGQNWCTILFQEQAPSCVLKFALRERVSGASSLVCTEICFAGACFRSKLPRVCWNLLCGSVFQEQAPSCILVGVLTREHVSGACFRGKLLRVYWLEYLPGSVFRERVSGASSLVCTGL